MSGGHFRYMSSEIDYVAEEIERIVRYSNSNEINEWERVVGRHYGQETIEEFIKGAKILRLAAIYERRIDWLLSGDDGEEAFAIRLKNDIEALEREYKND